MLLLRVRGRVNVRAAQHRGQVRLDSIARGSQLVTHSHVELATHRVAGVTWLGLGLDLGLGLLRLRLT